MGVPSLPAVHRETQTTPPPSPPRKEHWSTDTLELEEAIRARGWKHQGVDTWDLVLGMRGLSVATQTDWEKAGGIQRSVVEAGIGDIKATRDEIPGGLGEDLGTGSVDRKMGAGSRPSC